MEPTGRRPGQIICPFAGVAIRLCLLLLLVALGNATYAQGPGEPTYTLHVYNNLVQFATIVLTDNLTTPQPIPRSKFDITLDGGPVFHPTQMRREGDDPIELAVLLDAGGSQRDLLARFPEAFAGLMPAFLHANDHISIYAEDCNLVRSLHAVPADAAVVRAGINAALNSPTLHGTRRKSACGSHLPLWDNLLLVSSELASQPGRRVILLISDGDEYRSKTAASDVAHFASSKGTAIFLMHDANDYAIGNDIPFRTGIASLAAPTRPETTIAAICHSSGGMAFHATPRSLNRRLQEFVLLLRERYIIEFPRPDDRAGGMHQILITLPDRNYFIRNTGATLPTGEPALPSDPNTLPAKTSPARYGTARPSN